MCIGTEAGGVKLQCLHLAKRGRFDELNAGW